MGVSQVGIKRSINDPNLSRIPVNQSVAGPTTLKAAQLNKRHRLVGAILTMSANGTMKFVSGSTDMSGPMDVAQYGGFVHDTDAPFFECNANEDLILVTTGGAARGVALVHTE